MGLIKFLFKSGFYSTCGAVGAFAVLTRKSQFTSLSEADAFKAAHLGTYNPHGNPMLRDRCVRRVRFDKIRPELLEQEGALVTEFCKGIWSGKGYEIQRRVLERKHHGPETAGQLWAPEQLAASDYSVGTQITDHFEVIEKTPERIVTRCGGSPRTRGVRANDGIFEMGAKVIPEEGCVEFALESVFYQGLGKTAETIPTWMEFLHQQYTKVWMETAVWHCMR